MRGDGKVIWCISMRICLEFCNHQKNDLNLHTSLWKVQIREALQRHRINKLRGVERSEPIPPLVIPFQLNTRTVLMKNTRAAHKWNFLQSSECFNYYVPLLTPFVLTKRNSWNCKPPCFVLKWIKPHCQLFLNHRWDTVHIVKEQVISMSRHIAYCIFQFSVAKRKYLHAHRYNK